MFQMVRPGSVSDASHLSYARFFFFLFFFGPGSVQKRKDINLLPNEKQTKIFEKVFLFLLCIVFLSCQSTENVYTKWETRLQITKTEITKGRNPPSSLKSFLSPSLSFHRHHPNPLPPT